MTAAAKGIKCQAKQWTLLTTGKQNVTVRIRGNGVGYIRPAAALPVDTPSMDAANYGTSAADFMTISSEVPGTFGFADTTTNLYLYAPFSDVVVETISE